MNDQNSIVQNHQSSHDCDRKNSVWVNGPTVQDVVKLTGPVGNHLENLVCPHYAFIHDKSFSKK